MRLLPPDGWRCTEDAERSTIVGFDASPVGPLVALQVILPACFVGVGAEWVVYCAAVLAVVVVAALLRGFRLEISPRGFVLSRTWAGLAYARARLPLESRVELRTDFEDDTDVVIIVHDRDEDALAFGSPRTATALKNAAAAARARWARSPQPYR